MARDAELDRLKTAQKQAYQRKEDARIKQDKAWERRSAARDTMNRLYDDKERKRAEQDRSWENYQAIKRANGPQIDTLNQQQEQAHQNMVRAFENSKAAYERGNGADAKTYSLEGHEYKAEAQRYVAERRKLVAEIREARNRHEGPKVAFQEANNAFKSYKRNTFDRTKDDHDKTRADLSRAKAELDTAANNFRARLEIIKAQGQKRRDKDKAIAIKAEVPHDYLDNIKARRNSDGSYDIFYGGIDKPDGFGHGHATLDRFGRAAHDRRPFDINKPENFTDDDAYIEYKRSQRHIGGYGLAHYGYIDGRPVTFACGWGTKDGHTLIADGHVDKITFRHSKNHNHYGPGEGPRNNAKDRGQYTGPGV